MSISIHCFGRKVSESDTRLMESSLTTIGMVAALAASIPSARAALVLILSDDTFIDALIRAEAAPYNPRAE